MALHCMSNILCHLSEHIYQLDYDTTSTKEGHNYFEVLHSTHLFRFYFTVKDGKIFFSPIKTETARQDAITSAIFTAEHKVKLA